MRFLCLHGAGTSGAIFKSQTMAFRSRLSDEYQFDFVDAPYEAEPAPGIQVFYDAGHRTWFPKLTANAVKSAHRWLLDYIEEHGPYDAVCCFSQGCSLAGTLLMYHYREVPNEPPPFKAAMFICGGLPMPSLEDLGISVSDEAYYINNATSKILREKAGALTKWAANPSMIRPGVGLWENTSDLLHDPAVLPNESDVFGLDFTTMPEDIRIRIPTVHVYGAKDPRWPASLQLAHMCRDRQMFDHGGGHDIPRTREVSTQIAEYVKYLEQAIQD